MTSILHLTCPSGLAGNLFGTALVSVGLPPEIVFQIPRNLGLPEEFQVTFDGYAYDGEYAKNPGVIPPFGYPSDMIRQVKRAYPGATGEKIEEVLAMRYKYDMHPIGPGESWCDTMFDATMAVVGLQYFGYPQVIVHGALPATHRPHPVAAKILEGWEFKPSALDMELVTPTAAAILRVFASQTMEPAPMYPGTKISIIQGRFARANNLEHVQVSN